MIDMEYIHNHYVVVGISFLAVLICLGAVLPNYIILETVEPVVSLGQRVLARATLLPAEKEKVNQNTLKIKQKQDQRLRGATISVVKRAGHIGLFALLGFFVGWGIKCKQKKRWSSFVSGGLLLVCFACFSEGLQYLTVSRNPSLADLSLDLWGAGAGYIVAWLFCKA